MYREHSRNNNNKFHSLHLAELTFYIALMGASYGELAETVDGDAINRYHVEHIYIIGAMYNH